jgi:tetratricopeptide (TPR) repeat protein
LFPVNAAMLALALLLSTRAAANPSIQQFIEAGNAQQALVLLQQRKGSEANTAQHHFLVGRAHQDLGQNPEALASYSIALFLDPNNYRAYVNRGLVKGALRDFPGSLADFRAAIALNPQFAPAHLNAGVTLGAMNQPKEAIASFSTAIDLDGNYADAYRNRGITQHHLGNRQAACNDWRTAVQRGASDVQAWVNAFCR